MGQRMLHFDFVSRKPPPMKQEGSSSSHGGVTIDSIYYYGKSVYQDVNLRSYFGLIHPPTRLTFSFHLVLFPKKSCSDRPTSQLLKRTLPVLLSSLNYSVIQYLLNTKNKIHFDPVVVLNNFVASGMAEQSTMGGANA
uniref:Uncharacterized protein n=1 Tax=Solanum lycopersicum TaxID=4081 RepID=K4C0S4_SOLLC